MTPKEELHEACVSILTNRIDSLKGELSELQKSQNSETKSSAGDKYETAREMINLEKNKLAGSVEEAVKMHSFLKQIDPKKTLKSVEVGALVKTNKGQYFVSVGLGAVSLGSERFFVISPVSPVGQLLLNKKVGETFEINKQQHELIEIL